METIILRTQDERELERIVEEHVQAVIYAPSPPPAWVDDVARAVERGALSVPRTILPRATRDEIEACLSTLLPEGCLAPEVRGALLEDVLGLVDRLASRTGASRFMLRIFTEAPTTECGFHVDTVPPGAPTWGLLRVYNGAGTEFVEPDNVIGVREFYGYLSRRERLERERRDARRDGRSEACDRLDREIAELDDARPFLRRGDEIGVAPTGAIVAFKHLDVRLLWAPHAKAKAWIHCSPMQGSPRLVVNVTAPDPAPRGRR